MQPQSASTLVLLARHRSPELRRRSETRINPAKTSSPPSLFPPQKQPQPSTPAHFSIRSRAENPLHPSDSPSPAAFKPHSPSLPLRFRSPPGYITRRDRDSPYSPASVARRLMQPLSVTAVSKTFEPHFQQHPPSGGHIHLITVLYSNQETSIPCHQP
jgi:hypothetical protein